MTLAAKKGIAAAAQCPNAGGRCRVVSGALYGSVTSDAGAAGKRCRSARPGGGRALRGGVYGTLIPRGGRAETGTQNG
ncbi:hypothetical protein ACSSV4_001587 [Roseovarius sp. MBR-154]|jgi:hypothetical protein